MQSSRRVAHLGRALLDDRLGRYLLRRALLLHAVAASHQHRTIALRQRTRDRTPASALGVGHVQVAARSVDACAGTLWHTSMLAASREGLITGVAFLDAGMSSSAVDSVAQSAKVAIRQRSTHTQIHRNIVRSQAWTWLRGAIACSRRGRRADRLAAGCVLAVATTVREGVAVAQDTAAAQHLTGSLRWRHGRPDSGCGAEAGRQASARTDRHSPSGRHGHASAASADAGPAFRRPPPARARDPSPVLAGPQRAENARTDGDGPGAQWALPCFRDTATHGRQRAGPSFLVALSLSHPSSPPSPCRVRSGLVGSATQITRSLETRTESPRLPLSLQQCNSASRRFL